MINIQQLFLKPSFSNINSLYTSIRRKGWFVLRTTEYQVAVFHGIKLQDGSIGFQKQTIDEVKVWLSLEKTRKVLCCYSAFLPIDIKERAVCKYKAPIYINKQRGKVLNKGKVVSKLDISYLPEEVITNEISYSSDNSFYYGSAPTVNYFDYNLDIAEEYMMKEENWSLDQILDRRKYITEETKQRHILEVKELIGMV